MSSAFWDQFAPSEVSRAARNPEDALYEQQLLPLLADFVEPDDRLLDIGGGPGRFSLPLARLVREIEHIDFSPAMLEVAETRARHLGAQNIRFAQHDARDLSAYPSQSFTKVLSINTPLSFAASDWRRALHEMCRVTGGEAIFTVASFLSCMAVLLNASVAAGEGWGPLVSAMASDHVAHEADMRRLGKPWPSYRAFSPGELEPEIDRCGFDIVEVRGLAILSRLMSPDTVAQIAADDELTRRLLELDDQLARSYGVWAPSRELMYRIRRRR